MNKLPPVKTNDLTKQTIRMLSIMGWYVWRNNNAGVFDPTKKVFRRNSAKKGVSDILGFNRKTGIVIACEIKAGKDKLRPEQVDFLDQVKKAGGIAIVVRTTDDVINLNELIK